MAPFWFWLPPPYTSYLLPPLDYLGGVTKILPKGESGAVWNEIDTRPKDLRTRTWQKSKIAIDIGSIEILKSSNVKSGTPPVKAESPIGRGVERIPRGARRPP